MCHFPFIDNVLDARASNSLLTYMQAIRGAICLAIAIKCWGLMDVITYPISKSTVIFEWLSGLASERHTIKTQIAQNDY